MTAFDLYEAESVRHVRVPVQGPSLPGAAWGRVAGDLVTFVLFIREQMSAYDDQLGVRLLGRPH